MSPKKKSKKEKSKDKKRRRESQDSSKKKSRRSTGEEPASTTIAVTSDEGAVAAKAKDEDMAIGGIVEKNEVSKKVTSSTAKASSSTTVTVHVKDANPTEDPVVVSFPRGVPSSVLAAENDARAEAGTGRTVRFQQPVGSSSAGSGAARSRPTSSIHSDVPHFSWSKLRPTSSRGKSILGSDRTCSYAASNEGRGHDGRLTKLYIGIYDREAKTLSLQPSAEKGTVFPLSQTVKEYQSSLNSNGPVDATMKSMSASERRSLLFESFGSAKKQRALRSQAANVVSIDSVIGAGDAMMEAVGRQDMGESNRKAMDDAAAGRTMLNATEAALAEARRKFLPPFDENADAPHNVYNASDVAGDDVWGYVSRITDACTKKEGDWREHLTSRGYWHDSIKSLLNAIHISRKGAAYQIKTAVLLNSMMKFHGKCNKNFVRGGSAEELAKRFNVSNDVVPRLLDLFAIQTNDSGDSGYAITKQLKDKRLVYMLILYLLANGREMKVGSINDFCRDIQLELNDAAKFLREAGFEAKKSGSSGQMSVSLKVPLTFPRAKRGKR